VLILGALTGCVEPGYYGYGYEGPGYGYGPGYYSYYGPYYDYYGYYGPRYYGRFRGDYDYHHYGRFGPRFGERGFAHRGHEREFRGGARDFGGRGHGEGHGRGEHHEGRHD
jgi:hypothetical protein